MRIALAGPPGGGRTTLFRALAGSRSADSSSPLTVQVPDARVDFLAEIWHPRKIVHTSIVFTDTPSPAFSPKSLADLRDASVIALVLDNYACGTAAADFLECESEMIIADLSVIEKRMERLTKEGRSKTLEAKVLEEASSLLSDGKALRTGAFDQDALVILSPFAPLTLKPLFVVSNRADAPLSDEAPLLEHCGKASAKCFPVNAAFELELTEIPEDEQEDFLESMGYSETGLNRLVKGAFEALDLIVFLTMGHDEVRAWPLARGSSAVEAAGRIHTDLARGFIRAQVVPYADFQACPDMQKLKERNLVRLEGRDYVVGDGDILEIRFSV